MTMELIIGLPLVAGLGLLYWSSQLDEDSTILKLMLQFMFFPLLFLSIHFAIIYVSLIYDANVEMIDTLANMTFYLGWLFFGVGLYYIFSIFGKVRDIILQKKQEKEREKYD